MLVDENEIELLADFHTKAYLGEGCVPVGGKMYYSHWGHLVQTPQISADFKDKNSHVLVVSWVFRFTQVLYK